MTEVFDWLQPVPFWETEATAPSGTELIRPVLLEFASDNFMEDFLAEATSGRTADWQKLEDRIIAPEGGKGLKLFQPAHLRYYLVCASLCCRQPGFPDRMVRRAEGESVFFVLRKVDVDGKEYGWSVEGKTKSWQTVTAKTLTPNEERLPLFSTASGPCGRSLVYGYIPVASRDTYAQQVTVTDPDPASERLRLLGQFDENIVRALDTLRPRLNSMPSASTAEGRKIRALWEQISLFLLSDLAEWLEDALPAVYGVIALNRPDSTLSRQERAVISALQAAQVKEVDSSDRETGRTAIQALKKVIDRQDEIDDLSGGSDPLPVRLRIAPSDGNMTGLRAKVASALEYQSMKPPAETQMAELPKLNADNGETFLLRCVYERPCDPPFPPRLRISEATHPFRMASFFDTNAPARPIRIELPTDVSLASIRKFRKGVGFLMSNAMRNKMDMVKPETLTGETNAEGEWSLGMLCSFSLQIIFICAFVLLIIIAFVLNIVFWWLPFFRICLPIPKKGD